MGFQKLAIQGMFSTATLSLLKIRHWFLRARAMAATLKLCCSASAFFVAHFSDNRGDDLRCLLSRLHRFRVVLPNCTISEGGIRIVIESNKRQFLQQARHRNRRSKATTKKRKTFPRLGELTRLCNNSVIIPSCGSMTSYRTPRKPPKYRRFMERGSLLPP